MVSFRSLATLFLAATAAVSANFTPAKRGLHGHQERGLLDVCVSVDQDLSLVFKKHGIVLPPAYVQEDVQLCLCVGLIPNFIQLHLVTRVAASIAGIDVITNILVDLILGHHGKQTCQYPEHSAPICKANDPCGFTCKDGFVKQGNQCVCPSPNNVCNGKCGVQACPSAGVVGRRHLHDRHTCPTGLSACGVANQGWAAQTTGAYECLDTRSNLDSCGGCAIPLFGKRATGTDCGAIPGVERVACSAGACLVESCRAGWKVSTSGSACDIA